MVEFRLRNKIALVRKLLLITLVTIAFTILLPLSPGQLQADGKQDNYTNFLPMVMRPRPPQDIAIMLVNEVRMSAGVPVVDNDSRLSGNCFDHARYMAKNNVLTHEQDPNLPYASARGQICADHANAWLGNQVSEADDWTSSDSVEGWVSSVGHRLWLLYPTTEAIGYGFFDKTPDHRAAAALDVLSTAKFEEDDAYEGWPVRYPTEDAFVPATRFPITLQWRYFGPKPVLLKTRLETAAGKNIAHDASTDLPAEHKGIQIIPRENLPPNSDFTVTVRGSYEGQAFKLTWKFRTGS